MFLKYIKDSSSKEITCCKFSLFKKSFIRKEKEVKFFNGLITFYSHYDFEKYLKIFNIPIYHLAIFKEQKNKTQKFHLFKMLNIKKYYQDQIFKQTLDEVGKGFKNIVFIRSAIGETYMLQFFLEEYMKKRNLSFEDTCFVNWREPLGDLFKMYNPKVNFKQIDFNVGNCFYCLEKDFYEFNNVKFHIFVDRKFIYELMDMYKKSYTKTYYNELLKHYEIEKENTIEKFSIYTQSDICSYNQKIKYLNLNLNKFIILAPEALSIEPINKEFWLKIEQKLISKGYDIYWNISNEDIFLEKKFANLNLIESKYLADKAKGIIGLSSGFIETLSRCNCKQNIIYTPLKMNGICAENMMKVYSKKYFPYVNKENIFEFVYRQNEEKDLIDKILEVY